LSGGDDLAVVGGEEHLRLAVLGDEYLVFAGGSVPRLYHGVSPDRRQIPSGHVAQCYAAQLPRRPVAKQSNYISEVDLS